MTEQNATEDDKVLDLKGKRIVVSGVLDGVLAAFEAWRNNTQLGSSFCYHRGNLSYDRLQDPELDKAASRIYQHYYLAGSVMLIQKTAWENDIEYLAIGLHPVQLTPA